MKSYANRSGTSGVRYYEIVDTSITVQFQDGATYLYTYESAGENNIEQMKSLALSGSGLNSYINTNVRKLYASKLR